MYFSFLIGGKTGVGVVRFSLARKLLAVTITNWLDRSYFTLVSISARFWSGTLIANHTLTRFKLNPQSDAVMTNVRYTFSDFQSSGYLN